LIPERRIESDVGVVLKAIGWSCQQRIKMGVVLSTFEIISLLTAKTITDNRYLQLPILHGTGSAVRL
jgi:hypothetical protein